MRSTTSPDLLGRCPRCYLLRAWCLCAQIPRIETSLSILVVRHFREAYKTTNTGRFALLSMPNARLLEYGTRDVVFDHQTLEAPQSALLFPGPGPGGLCTERPKQLIVVDGTWSQASHMVNRIPGLRALPRLSLDGDADAVTRLRQPLHQSGRSTLEAIAAAVALFDGEEAARPLYALHQTVVRQILQARGRPEHDHT